MEPFVLLESTERNSEIHQPVNKFAAAHCIGSDILFINRNFFRSGLLDKKVGVVLGSRILNAKLLDQSRTTCRNAGRNIHGIACAEHALLFNDQNIASLFGSRDTRNHAGDTGTYNQHINRFILRRLNSSGHCRSNQ